MVADHRELCVIHANCQGEPLALLLQSSPEFAARWRVCLYTNYTREAIPDSALREATLFLYQNLGPEWGDVASAALLDRLGPGAVPVCIPNMFFTGYWPFWTSASPMDFGDFFLDRLHASGAGKPEMLRVYLHGNIAKMADLEGNVRETLRREREKEAACDVTTADFVAANWQKTRLFQTVNHPDAPLLMHAAGGLLAHLGLPPLPAMARESFTYGYEGFQLPIHPKVAAFFTLAFAGEETQYPVFGRSMTFAQYVSRYIDCRLHNLEDNFLGFLQIV